MIVSEIRNRRVLEGHLGCPECEARYPIHRGVIDFDAAPGEGSSGHAEQVPPSSAAADPSGPDDSELATEVAALLGLREGGGIVYLAGGLARHADEMARLAPGTEVLAPDGAEGAGSDAAAPEGAGGGAPGGVSRARGLSPGDLPVVSGRLRGVALAGSGDGSASASELAEAIRVLAPDGRLVVLRPAPGTREHLREQPVEILAEGERALVAARST